MSPVKLTDTKSDSTSTEAPSSKPSSATKRHSKFYFDNTLVVIQIGDTLFNVHKYQLTKSETFPDMFNMPKEENDEPEEGLSPEHPIVMDGVSASDFEALLTVLYATHFSTNQPAPEASLIIPSFRLANMWNFKDLRSYLLPLAEKVLEDVDKIVFAREFDLKSWLAPAHLRLCQRPEVLTTDEATKLGVHSLLMISRMREQYRVLKTNSGGQIQHYYCGNCVVSHSGSGGRTARCTTCDTQTTNTYFYNQSPNASNTLETQVNQWVESGCVLAS